MNKNERAGPAFPVVPDMHEAKHGYDGERWNHGMSLRDWFAGMALQGWLASFPGGSGPPNAHVCARLAYALADAMLKAREEDCE